MRLFGRVSLLFIVMLFVVAQNNEEKEPEEEWLTEGNSDLDSTEHFLGTVDGVPLIFKTNNLERMRITSNGFIGIGIAVPQYPLHVNATTKINTIYADYVHVNNGLTIGDLHFCRGISCGVDTVHTTQGRDLLLRSNKLLGFIADTIRVESEVAPQVNFRITGNTYTNELYINSSKIAAGNLLMLDNNKQVVGLNVKLSQGGVGGGNAQCSPDYILTWTQPLNAPLGLPQGTISKYPTYGNVGIGVCVPQAKVHIKNVDNNSYSLLIEGTTSYDTSLVVTSENTVGIGVGFPTAVLEVVNTFSYDDIIKLRNSGGNPFFVVKSNGNVGIGTTLPISSLHIYSDNKNPRSITVGTDIDYTKISKGEINYFGDTLRLNSTSGTPIVVGASSKQVPLIVPYKAVVGNMKLPSGDYAFGVDGKIRCREVNVDMKSWPDFVFEKDYYLMPWEEFIQYCFENKHIPGVPSMDTIVSNGLSVGEMNYILLQKIEELILYINQLEKRVKELEKKLNNE